MGPDPHMEGKPADDAERDSRADQLRCQGQKPDDRIRIRLVSPLDRTIVGYGRSQRHGALATSGQ